METTEAWRALSNALKLGASLVATWGVALAVRFALPRHLGPELFGTYSFVDGFAATFFVLASLGVDTYVQREVPVRPEHASEFLGGVLAARVTLGGVLLVALEAALWAAGRPREVQLTAGLLALGQLGLLTNGTLAALLHARGTVDGLSLANVASKLLWGAGIALALAAGTGLTGLAASFLFSELLRALVLYGLCRRHLALRLRVDWRASARVLRESMPFFVGLLATTLATRLDITLIALLEGDMEAGWYGAASNLAQLALLLTPLLSAVLLPLLARLAARSAEAFTQALRRSMEATLALAVPVTLALGLGAEVWVALLFGPEFAPASTSLVLLAPLFVLTYVAILCSTALNLLGRAWTATLTCLAGLVLNAALNLLLIPLMRERLGPGGAGAGAALSTLGTEAFICALQLLAVGRRVVDAQVLGRAGRLLATCVLVIGVDRLWAGPAPARLVVDGVAWCVLAVLTGALRPAELRTALATVRSR